MSQMAVVHVLYRLTRVPNGGVCTVLADMCSDSNIKRAIQRIASDQVCEVHQTMLGIREGKEGWFHLYCPGGIACDDDGQLWGLTVSNPVLTLL